MAERGYVLAPGTQVREEDFGLLFYTMAGPRLYFLSSGNLLNGHFFNGEWTLDQWVLHHPKQKKTPRSRLEGLIKSLKVLKEKGVILEC